MFGMYFTNETHYPSHNIRDLDSIDIGVHSDLKRILSENDTFDLLVTHFLGIDHAGHTFYANHSEIERKVLETEEYITEIISLLPEDVTLLLYGDHGMTNDGNHGGGTQNEIKTVLFAYSKQGFPMLKDSEIRSRLYSD